MGGPISLDNPSTWPPELRELAIRGAEDPSCQHRCTSDVRPAIDLAQAIKSMIAERGIIVYQCARLLDSEVEDIRTTGLRAASQRLLADKVAAAHQAGLLTNTQVKRIMTSGVLANAEQQLIRTNEICALTILRTIEVDADGVAPLFENWGGEITYFWQQTGADPELEGVLRTIGRPALIAFHHYPIASDGYYPELANLVISSWQQLADCRGEVHIQVAEGARVPVLDISQPGDAGWPRELMPDENANN